MINTEKLSITLEKASCAGGSRGPSYNSKAEIISHRGQSLAS